MPHVKMDGSVAPYSVNICLIMEKQVVLMFPVTGERLSSSNCSLLDYNVNPMWKILFKVLLKNILYVRVNLLENANKFPKEETEIFSSNIC